MARWITLSTKLGFALGCRSKSGRQFWENPSLYKLLKNCSVFVITSWIICIICGTNYCIWCYLLLVYSGANYFIWCQLLHATPNSWLVLPIWSPSMNLSLDIKGQPFESRDELLGFCDNFTYYLIFIISSGATYVTITVSSANHESEYQVFIISCTNYFIFCQLMQTCQLIHLLSIKACGVN